MFPPRFYLIEVLKEGENSCVEIGRRSILREGGAWTKILKLKTKYSKTQDSRAVAV